MSTVQPALQIVGLSPERLKPNPNNPRTHKPSQVRRIAKSIETFGFIVPIIIDELDNVLVGHGRLLAARHLDMPEVPTICVRHLTPEQRRAFTIADNRLTEMSIWDERLLAEQLKELSLVGVSLDVEVTGFDMGEIDLMIEGLEPVKEDDADLIPPPSATPAVSCVGDVFELGRHRVCCGSALEESAYAALIQGQQAAMVFTDPPYNVPISGHVCGMGRVQHREFAMASGEMSVVEFTDFLRRGMQCMAKCSRSGAVHFICMDFRHIGELLAAGADVYAKLLNLCVWAKTQGGMGSLYRSQHELVFVFQSGEVSHRNNVQLGRYGRNRTNLWTYASPNAPFGRKTEEGRLLELHPTVKPVALVADAILDCSARGDIVLDPFLGSGTTVIAAERTGRICYGIELDPVYVDTVIRRWEAYTGEQARHVGTGKTFDEIAQDRSHSND